MVLRPEGLCRRPQPPEPGAAPHFLEVVDLAPEGSRSLTFRFKATPESAAAYRKLTLKRTDGGMIGGKEQVTVFDGSEPELQNRFPIDTDANTAQVVITEDLLPGEYQLTVDYQD